LSVRDLAERESGCCSFLTFVVGEIGDGAVGMSLRIIKVAQRLLPHPVRDLADLTVVDL
jgi:hypothetical protein